MSPVKNKFHLDFRLSLQEEFAGVVTRALCRACRDVESLRPKEVPVRWGRGRMGEAMRHPGQEHAGAGVEGLFESLLAESFGGGA